VIASALPSTIGPAPVFRSVPCRAGAIASVPLVRVNFCLGSISIIDTHVVNF
jgi:hypothetical protein